MVRINQLQQKEMENKDIRGKFMQEIFSGIKVTYISIDLQLF